MKKGTIADIAKNLECIKKNTCKEIDLSAITNKLDNVVTKLGEVKTTISTLDTNLQNKLGEQTTALSTKLDELKTTVGQGNTKMSEVVIKITQGNTKLDELKTKIDELKAVEQAHNHNDVVAKLTELSTKLDGIKSEITSMKTMVKSEFDETQAILNGEIVEYKEFHKIVENGGLNKNESNNIYSFSFTVIEGTADVTIDGVTITYPIGNVLGATFDGKIGSKPLKSNVVITATGTSKVLVTGIKKA